jgi:hypothetical protein
MKINVDIDCTPEEARRFLGLPDLTPIHQAYVERMAMLAGEGLTADSAAEMMKAWGPMNEAGLAMWRSMLAGMGGKQS